MDNLEKYIKDHREEFDSEEPREEVWMKISTSVSGTHTQKKIGTGWIWKAAAVFLMLTTTYLLVDRWQQAGEPVEEPTLSAMDDFSEAESYFLSEIEKGRKLLTSYEIEEPVEREFHNDLEQLDEMYNELKKDYKEESSNEKVAEALIQNLRIRMEIINQQLMILERIKRTKENENVEI